MSRKTICAAVTIGAPEPCEFVRSVTGMKLACGTDIVEIGEFARDLELGGERFLRRIYTEGERAFCRGRVERLATRFAAKEATAKALGTGIRGVSWTEIEIVSAANGKPRLVLHGRAAARAAALGLQMWAVSLSHSRAVALAYVVALRL